MSLTALLNPVVKEVRQAFGLSGSDELADLLKKLLVEAAEDELAPLLSSPSYAERFFRLCDRIDQAVNGRVEWNGKWYADPWNKRVSFEMILYFVTWATSNIDEISRMMRQGTEYDEANLPPKP